MILVIVLAGLFFRLIALNQSLWLDEAINVNVAKDLDYWTLISKYSLGDFHPPLFHLILKTWITFFGSSEISARFPSVIFSLGTIFTTFLIAKKLFEKKTAIIAATLLATSPLHIYYSQEARMYMLAAFFASLSVYFFISLIKKDVFYYWLGFIISTALMLYSDYLPYMLIPTYIIYLFQNRRKIIKSSLKTFFPAFIIIFILVSPWLLILPQQFEGGLITASNSPAWAKVVGSPSTSSLILTFVKFTIGRISVDNNLNYAILFSPIAAFIAILFVLSIFRMSNSRTFLWYWFTLPIFLAFVISFYVPVFSYFRFIFVLPAFYIILACAINTINWQKLVRTFLLIALVINIGSTVIYLQNPKFQRENWRSATSYVINSAKGNSIVLFEADYPAGPFDYYNKGKLEASGAISNFNANEQDVEKIVGSKTKDKDKVFLFQYLSGITDPKGIVYQQITKNGFRNTKTTNFSGVGFVYEFEK